MRSTINVLGTTYKIKITKFSKDPVLVKNNFAGYCNPDLKLIVLTDLEDVEKFPDMTEQGRKEYRKKLLRHEIIHAFFAESGLNWNTFAVDSWADNEEMVDWIAIQFPKMLAVFKELGIES